MPVQRDPGSGEVRQRSSDGDPADFIVALIGRIGRIYVEPDGASGMVVGDCDGSAE